MSPAQASLCRDLAAGFALSALAALEAGDEPRQRQAEALAAHWERQADRA